MKTAARIIALGLVAFVGTAAGNPPATLTMIPPLINYQGRLVARTTRRSDNNHVIDLTLSDGLRRQNSGANDARGDQGRVFSVNLGSGGSGLLAATCPSGG